MRGRGSAVVTGAADQRVKELERQVRGLNDIIKRRFPNSLSALIIATNSTSSRGENPTRKYDVGHFLLVHFHCLYVLFSQ